MKQGPGLEPGDAGRAARQPGAARPRHRLPRHRQEGRREGARPAASATRRRASRGGYFVKPTVFTGVRNDMRIAQEEIFGPVVSRASRSRTRTTPCCRATTRSTASPPACGRATSRRRTAWRARIRAGTVWVNCYNVFDVVVAVRRLQAERLRPRAGPPRARPLHAGEERLDADLSVARVASFGEIADEFERRWQRTIWATMATVGAERAAAVAPRAPAVGSVDRLGR